MLVNPFVPNALFLSLPPENIRKPHRKSALGTNKFNIVFIVFYYITLIYSIIYIIYVDFLEGIKEI